MSSGLMGYFWGMLTNYLFLKLEFLSPILSLEDKFHGNDIFVMRRIIFRLF